MRFEKGALGIGAEGFGRVAQQPDPLGIGRKFFQKFEQTYIQFSVATIGEQVVKCLGKGIALDAREGRIPDLLGGVLFVKFLDQAVHELHAQRQYFGFVGNAEGGGEPQLFKIVAHGALKEGVDRGDLRAAKHQKLMRQTAVAGVFCQGVGECRGDPALQFSRGGTGKGDHKQAREIGGVFAVGQTAYDALGQHTGFSRACRRRYQQRFSSQVDRGFL